MGPIDEGAARAAAALNLSYQGGFGNEFATESVAGSLPVGRNSPQRVAHGLYAEVLSGTAFTAPRAENLRTWLYKMRPSAMHGPFKRIGDGLLRSGPFDEAETPPNRLRWDPLPMEGVDADFIDGLATVAGSGDPASQAGIAIHVYRATRSMADRCFVNADGEMMIVPQQGGLLVFAETGRLTVVPGEICVIPRGMKFRVELLSGPARGYVCENYGAQFRLPELGPIGSNGLANPRDFLAPVAAWEDKGPTEVVSKFMGGLWAAEWRHSPLDTVAWHGTCTAYKYDLARFMVINTVSFDHCDPSIFTVMTAPSGQPGVANVDFVIFPPRWAVAEGTFRPPWFHRNYMSELMGLVHGVYDAKAEGFLPGGVSLHNSMTAHGPDVTTFENASKAELKPHKIDNSLAFMFESRYVFRPTRFAMEAPQRQKAYDSVWGGFQKHFMEK